MHKLTNHAKSGLFLMEMIMCLLFLGLACAICLRLFGAAYLLREEARLNNHIQEIIVNTSELLEGWDGSPDTFEDRLRDLGISAASVSEVQGIDPDTGIPAENGDTIQFFYTRRWVPCSLQEAYYAVEAVLKKERLENTMNLNFYRTEDKDDGGDPFYHYSVSFPALQTRVTS